VYLSEGVKKKTPQEGFAKHSSRFLFDKKVENRFFSVFVHPVYLAFFGEGSLQTP
jgi:hypothetical protein